MKYHKLIIILLICVVCIIKYLITSFFKTHVFVNVHVQPSSALTIVLLNYKRPHNIMKSVPILHSYEHVHEIVIINGLKENIVNFDHLHKVVQFQHDNTIGGAIRFYATCNHDHIMFLDDDHIPSEKYVNMGLHILEHDKTAMLGNTSRMCSDRYYIIPFSGNMVLTQCMFVHKDTLELIMELFDSYYYIMKENRGNGEDILFNHLYKKLYNRLPIVLLPYGHMQTLDQDTGSYRGKQEHMHRRSQLCNTLHSQ